MAELIIRKVIDDIDPDQEADGTVSFSFEGTDYEIDLSDKNTEDFRKDMSKWVEAARRAGKRGVKKSRGPQPEHAGLPLGEIRKWALANGHEVSDRGRVSQAIVRAWETRDKAAPAAPAPEPEPPAKKAPAKRAAKTPAPEPAFSG